MNLSIFVYLLSIDNLCTHFVFIKKMKSRKDHGRNVKYRIQNRTHYKNQNKNHNNYWKKRLLKTRKHISWLLHMDDSYCSIH